MPRYVNVKALVGMSGMAWRGVLSKLWSTMLNFLFIYLKICVLYEFCKDLSNESKGFVIGFGKYKDIDGVWPERESSGITAGVIFN